MHLSRKYNRPKHLLLFRCNLVNNVTKSDGNFFICVDIVERKKEETNKNARIFACLFLPSFFPLQFFFHPFSRHLISLVELHHLPLQAISKLDLSECTNVKNSDITLFAKTFPDTLQEIVLKDAVHVTDIGICDLIMYCNALERLELYRCVGITNTVLVTIGHKKDNKLNQIAIEGCAGIL